MRPFDPFTRYLLNWLERLAIRLRLLFEVCRLSRTPAPSNRNVKTLESPVAGMRWCGVNVSLDSINELVFRATD